MARQPNRPQNTGRPRTGYNQPEEQIPDPIVSRKSTGKTSSGVPPLDAFDNLPTKKPPRKYGDQGQEAQQPQVRHVAPTTENLPRTRKNQSNTRGAAQARKTGPVPRATTAQATQNMRAVRPAAAQRRSRRIKALVALAVLILAGTIFSVAVLFRVEHFEVSGDSIYTLEQLSESFGVEPGAHMMSFNARERAAQMAQQLPYLEDIRVRRSLPGTIVFEVTPAIEQYYFSWDGKTVVLSQSGKVLAVGVDAPSGLIEIRGVGKNDVQPQAGKALVLADAEKNTALQAVISELAVQELDGVTWVDVSDIADIKLCWQNRITVLLGGSNSMDKKIRMMAFALADPNTPQIGPEERGTLDLSDYPAVSNEARFRPE